MCRTVWALVRPSRYNISSSHRARSELSARIQAPCPAASGSSTSAPRLTRHTGLAGVNTPAKVIVANHRLGVEQPQQQVHLVGGTEFAVVAVHDQVQRRAVRLQVVLLQVDRHLVLEADLLALRQPGFGLDAQRKAAAGAEILRAGVARGAHCEAPPLRRANLAG